MTDQLLTIAVRAARCHRNRRVAARGLCHSCYNMARLRGSLDQYPTERTQRFRGEFIADYELLRSEGYSRRQIAERLGMNRNSVDAAYARAVRAGDLMPDRRTA